MLNFSPKKIVDTIVIKVILAAENKGYTTPRPSTFNDFVNNKLLTTANRMVSKNIDTQRLWLTCPASVLNITNAEVLISTAMASIEYFIRIK